MKASLDGMVLSSDYFCNAHFLKNMNDPELTPKQEALLQHVNNNKFSRVVFQAFKNENVDWNCTCASD